MSFFSQCKKERTVLYPWWYIAPLPLTFPVLMCWYFKRLGPVYDARRNFQYFMFFLSNSIHYWKKKTVAQNHNKQQWQQLATWEKFLNWKMILKNSWPKTPCSIQIRKRWKENSILIIYILFAVRKFDVLWNILHHLQKKRKSDVQFKRPEGMHRELWGLLWTDNM